MCCACGGGDRSGRDPRYPFCDNTNNGFTDDAGDGCRYYVFNLSECGEWDNDNFKANEVCCACGGGEQFDYDAFHESSFVDNCDWYAEHREDCGLYDNGNFNASEMCEVCSDDYIPTVCVNDNPNGATDEYGDSCVWYDTAFEECGDFDDDDFIASEICCACRGGKQVPSWSVASTQLKGVTKKKADVSYTDIAAAILSAFATLAVAGWSIKTALTKRIQIQNQSDVFERLV